MGWTKANGPKCSAVSWNANPRIMLATPRSHTGRRARRNTSQTSKPAVSLLLAPMRWHTEAVAVHPLAATASRIAFSISTAFTSSAVSQPAWPWRAAEPDQPGSATAGQPTWPQAYSGWNSMAHLRNSPCQPAPPDCGHTGAVPYDPAIYLGSAPHYRYGRPAYSPGLEAVLTQEAGLDGTGRLMDAGCGPGVLTIRLAHLFEQAVGLDPDADMLAEGCRAADCAAEGAAAGAAAGAAEEKGVRNIRWVQGLAEDLPAVAPGPYKLVTFGQSFHWTDERHVAETVYDMLEPGGALALIVHTVAGRPRPPDPGVSSIPHDEITALVAKYLGSI